MSPNRRASERRFSGTLADRIRHARRRSGLSQAGLALQVGVVSSAVAQWEGNAKTSPTVEHLVRIAQVTSVAFEWLATGRGLTTATDSPAVETTAFACDFLEERLLIAFRKVAARKREAFVVWLEGFV